MRVRHIGQLKVMELYHTRAGIERSLVSEFSFVFVTTRSDTKSCAFSEPFALDFASGEPSSLAIVDSHSSLPADLRNRR
jgi:hypothetical protein